jgi:ABC-type multidrug transport system ATPase subunit
MDPNFCFSGEIQVNGKSMRNTSHLQHVIGYVPQEDICNRDMTVRENIWYSARVRLPAFFSAEQVNDAVDLTIEAMQLKKCAHSFVGDELTRGISGGERKRLNIAMEVVTFPTALFLDEPTSGLDSKTSLDVLMMLKDFAKRTNVTIVTVIHQPRIEIWENLDNIFLMCGGKIGKYISSLSRNT